jgi:hypothetical protein
VTRSPLPLSILAPLAIGQCLQLSPELKSQLSVVVDQVVLEIKAAVVVAVKFSTLRELHLLLVEPWKSQ